MQKLMYIFRSVYRDLKIVADSNENLAQHPAPALVSSFRPHLMCYITRLNKNLWTPDRSQVIIY